MLGIFKLSGGIGQISSDLSYSNPLLFESSSGGVTYEKMFYLRMEDPNLEKCEDGVLFSVNVLDGDDNWILLAPDNNGVAGNWDNHLDFSLDYSEEIPFWVQVKVPDDAVGARTDMKLAARYRAL